MKVKRIISNIDTRDITAANEEGYVMISEDSTVTFAIVPAPRNKKPTIASI